LNDIQSLENFFVRALSPPLTALLALSAVFVFVASFDFRLGWILLVFWFAAGIGVPVLAGWAGKPLGTRLVEQRSSLNVQMVDFVQGLADLQAFNRSGAMMEILLEQGDTLAESQQRMSALSSAQAAATGLLSHLGMWGVLILAIPLVAAGRIDGVYLAVVVLAGLTSFEAVTALPVAAQYLENNLQAVRRLYEVVDAKPEVVDPARPLPMPEKFDLRVQDLSFRYPVGETALEHVTFDLPQGKRMAIVGASGAGKSTLVDLLLRFWEVQEGQILLDGQALSAYSQEALRARISIVPQHVYLFSASLRDNLRMAAPSASDEDIIQAATLAGIHSFIESLPQGYETWAGEQGLQLSAGERQRIAIARALLKPASVLILDEGTANLDAISEAAVIESILRTLQDRSLLMITHRLTAMDQMDEIIVMDGGAVVQRGRHAELVRVEGLYSRLWHSRGAGMPGLGKQLY
jgi:ATP-binding cassette subfamily C protein CydC